MSLFAKKYTYLISYVILNEDNISGILGFGNSTLFSKAKGRLLIDQAIEGAKQVDPNAILMSICKVD